MLKGSTAARGAALNLRDVEFLLGAIKTHSNLHGSQIEQAVITIKKLQEFQESKRKALNEIYR